MYSKPKGLYIKHRERPLRKTSPRSEDEHETESSPEPEGRLSPEVIVDNFGEGQISAINVEIHDEQEVQWPKRDFESDENQTDGTNDVDTDGSQGLSMSTSPRSAEVDFPEKAQRYMVNNDSYKDLTRAKYITVPEPKKGSKKDEETVVTKRTNSESVQNFTRPQSGPIPSAYVKPVARVTGTYRGYPVNSPVKHGQSQSHIATIRIKPRHRGQKTNMATLRINQKSGTVRTVKGYHLGNNLTVRGHNTGHILKQLKNRPSLDYPDGTVGFKRSTVLCERKEYNFSEFAIEMDHPERQSYHPGDTLSGRIILDVKNKVEMRFVELLIIGMANIHFNKKDPNEAKSSQEVLINKRSYVMGTPDGRWNSVITPGKYVSKFRFTLPEHLPSTLKYENKEHGFSFEVGYMVKARICDEMGSSSARSTHSMNNYVKVLLTRRHPFFVRRSFDINSIPNSLQPVNHSEYVNLSCLPIFIDTASISLSLDRSVFLAGDDIRAKLVTSNGTAAKIKSLTCELQQRIFSSIRPRQSHTIVQVHKSTPEGLPFRKDSHNFQMFEFILPTQPQFIPSYLKGCQLMKASYSIQMTVVFKSCSGQVFLECPLGLGPCVDHRNPNKSNAVPIFNRPKRFPYFSKDSAPMQSKVQNGTIHI